MRPLHFAHAAKPGNGAAHQPHEQRFRLIFFMMRQRNGLYPLLRAYLRQRLIPGAARLVLRCALQAEPDDGQGHAQPVAQVGAERSVCIRICTQTVVYVNGAEAEGAFLLPGQAVQRVQERRGVRPAGQRQYNGGGRTGGLPGRENP